MGQRFSEHQLRFRRQKARHLPAALGSAACRATAPETSPGDHSVPDCVTPGLNLRALRQISGHKLLIPLPGAG
jgi:hypothetical protein